ncbi:MAG: error-prone DNA polymerase [Deltaproteobacteria bacterium]|nr:error-prone DNA polymerase [Deltaproteobacteria bacterium]MBN2671254.1 error-prone DNA polymerase [Deltaproteobacteria bacterium]
MYGINSYVPLWCKSNFSFLKGASHPEELVEEAHRLGLSAIAITDIDGVYGIVRAHRRAVALGIHLIIGAQVTLTDGSPIILLATNHEGYQNLCRIISKGRLSHPKGQSMVSLRTVCLYAEGLFALRPFCSTEKKEVSVITQLKTHFRDQLGLLLTRHKNAADPKQNHWMTTQSQQHTIPLVAATEILYHSRPRRSIQDVLTCVQHGVALTEARRKLRANAEHHLLSTTAFATLFADVPEAVDQTNRIAEQCQFSLSQIQYRYPSEVNQAGISSFERLRILTFEGARKRYDNRIPQNTVAQLNEELALINELDYPGYFLTMYEIVEFCKQHNILCQGRGSAANSAVCFCLGITAIDPVKMNLLFERFISRERNEPPDIDLDIEHNRREEVIQHVYTRYGRSHAAMVAVIVRYRPRSAVRDVGKTLGIDDISLGRLSKLLSRYGTLDPEAMEIAGFPLTAPLYQRLYQLTNELIDFPRHLSIHPGGFILGSDPIHTLVPVENATMPGRTVIQWDKDDVETLGLFKVDLLGLGALHHLHNCFDLLKETQQLHLDLASIPLDDSTFEMIQKGDTIGVFQIESRAQMSMLPRLRPKTFYDLVIQISIVRPGPITGGMVHPYLARRNGEEPISYPHPSLAPVLKKTLGIPLFQEQVMKIAILAADYTPGEADQLRRDMAAWKKSGRIDRHRERLISRMEKKGIAKEFAERVFEQIRGFGEYGFPESHAASFALISYASAYLRNHYPAEFTCALLNALPMGFYMPSTLVEDAKRKGVTVHKVNVKKSSWYCTVPLKNTILMGMRHIKAVGKEHYQKIFTARKTAPFTDMDDFTNRTALPSHVQKQLALSGALDSLNPNRRNALWNGLAAHSSPATSSANMNIPDSYRHIAFSELNLFDTITLDYALTGHSTEGHPLQLFRDILKTKNIPTASEINRYKNQLIHYVGMVICRQRPSTAAGVVFMTLEDETGFVNLICFRDVFEKYKLVAKTVPILGVTGQVQYQNGVTHVIAKELWRPNLPAPGKTAVTQSRDFR